MGYHSEVFQLTRVDLTDKYYAMVAPLSKGEADALNASSAPGAPTTNASELSDRILAVAIREWNLDDDDDKILPITSATVKILSQPHFKQLLETITRITNPLANPETLKN